MWRKFCSLNYRRPTLNIVFILFYFLGGNTAFSQRQTYTLDTKRDLIYAGVSGLSWGSFYYLQKQAAPLSIDQVNSLNPQTIPSYDRIAIHQYDITSRYMSNIFIYAAFAAKAAIFRKQSRKDLIAIGVVGYQSMLLSQALASGVKLGTKRVRPYAYNPGVPMDVRASRDARFSFFGAHTATVSSLCFTTALAYGLYYPDSRYKTLVWTSAFVLPAVEGFLRVNSGRQFPSDVITGYLVGLGTAYLMHYLHVKHKKQH